MMLTRSFDGSSAVTNDAGYATTTTATALAPYDGESYRASDTARCL